jgi:hypothetical protein
MISVLVPTRGRPHNMRRMVDSGRATSVGPVEYVFYVDNDDPESASMASTLYEEGHDVAWTTGERVVLSQMWNECFYIADPNSTVFQHSCDETIYRSAGWDRAVLDALADWPDHIGLVYGRDGIHDENLATHGFITREWVDAVGYFCPPYFSSDYNDLWLHEVAGGIGRRRFLPDVFTEHMHPAVGKGPLDQTHQDRLARHGQDGVDALWNQLLPKRQEDVSKLVAEIARRSELA